MVSQNHGSPLFGSCFFRIGSTLVYIKITYLLLVLFAYDFRYCYKLYATRFSIVSILVIKY